MGDGDDDLESLVLSTLKMDVLVPEFHSSSRKSNLRVASINLISTIVGGGVLSLPLAFQKCGIILASVLMLFAAAITELSLYMLCLSARQTGVNAYGEVGRMAFGQWMEWAISFLIFVFLLFVLVAYMVLVRDIWTPLAALIFRDVKGDHVLLGALLVMSPFLVQKELHSLRYNCYVGFASISILCIALCHHAILNELDGQQHESPSYFTSSIGDVLFAFPIIMLSFLSHFNVLPIQSALVKPTRGRVRYVIGGAVTSCFLLMYVFGLAGYLIFGSETKGNILINLDNSHDWLVFLGRIGCGITIMLAMAMMTLPCRDNVLELLDCWRERAAGNSFVTPPMETTPLVRLSIHDPIHQQHLANDPWWHYGMTFAIVLSCFFGAVAAPGVAIVWSLCGSSMAFLIAFVLPAACYLRIHHRDGPNTGPYVWFVFSWALLLFATLAAICCTAETTKTILLGPS